MEPEVFVDNATIHSNPEPHVSSLFRRDFSKYIVHISLIHLGKSFIALFVSMALQHHYIICNCSARPARLSNRVFLFCIIAPHLLWRSVIMNVTVTRTFLWERNVIASYQLQRLHIAV